MSAARWKKLTALLERAEHPGTPVPEARACVRTALKMVKTLQSRAHDATPRSVAGPQVSHGGGSSIQDARPCRVVRWQLTGAGCVAYADDKKITIGSRYVHGTRFYVLDFDGESVGGMYADIETARAEATGRLWVPESL